MAENVELKNPPISEAILDIKIDFPEGLEPSKSKLEKILQLISEDYPKCQEEVESENKEELEHEFDGYLCTSADENFIVALNINGLGFSEVNSYSGGNVFKERAMALWNQYVSIIDYGIVSRVGLRFINRLEIDIQGGDKLEEYIACPPRAPRDTTDVIGGFFSSVTVADSKEDICAVITQAMKHDADLEGQIYYLDIETYRFVEEGMEYDSIWELYDKLRELKNRIFFTSVTDKSLERYK